MSALPLNADFFCTSSEGLHLAQCEHGNNSKRQFIHVNSVENIYDWVNLILILLTTPAIDGTILTIDSLESADFISDLDSINYFCRCIIVLGFIYHPQMDD